MSIRYNKLTETSHFTFVLVLFTQISPDIEVQFVLWLNIDRHKGSIALYKFDKDIKEPKSGQVVVIYCMT